MPPIPLDSSSPRKRTRSKISFSVSSPSMRLLQIAAKTSVDMLIFFNARPSKHS